jgi:hypothetical protein
MIYRSFMSRSVVLCSLLLAACDVGSVLQHASGADGGGSDTGSGSNCGSAGLTPGGAHTHATGGKSNAGMGCMSSSGCHNSLMTPGGPAYSYAGTVYEADKTTPKPAATIFVYSGGKTIHMLSDMDGNFFVDEALATPPSNTVATTTSATLCPTIMMMGPSLVAGGGNCNSSSCHAAAAAAGAIHL